MKNNFKLKYLKINKNGLVICVHFILKIQEELLTNHRKTSNARALNESDQEEEEESSDDQLRQDQDDF